jgi:hypothetical protein
MDARARRDRGVWPTIARLTDCLLEEFVRSDLPIPCATTPVPGALLVRDYQDGQAWVRLVSAFPSSVFPSPTTDPRSCRAPLAFALEVGVSRCAPSGDSAEEPPDPLDMAASVELQTADMAAMHRAITCCLEANEYVLGSYAPFGPEGGVVGGTWTLTVAAP